MGKNGNIVPPLFETNNAAKGRIFHRLYILSMLVGICFVCVYRITHLPESSVAKWGWIAMFIAELWNIFYWLICQSLRLNPIHRKTFKQNLRQRYKDKDLPGVDVFVCTADHEVEPSAMVINTVLSVMAYDYPPEKLNVYLSDDDGGSEVMFYALFEASRFSKFWLPFCKKYKVEPRSPAAYFSIFGEIERQSPSDDLVFRNDYLCIKKLYNDMMKKIDEATKQGKVSEEQRKQHKGFTEWHLVTSKRDHHTILQILIDGIDSKSVDVEGNPLPTLVYLSREKRPQHHHHFKAGALNALIRVSSRISNNPIILTMDCDMYSNSSASVRDALCFFLDQEKGQDIGFVQFPQSFGNIKKNDIYASELRAIFEVEFYGLDGNGGMFYIGTGCFHRRDALCGNKYERHSNTNRNKGKDIRRPSKDVEETCKVLAGCTYEENTPWGKEVGVKYGISAEDFIRFYVKEEKVTEFIDLRRRRSCRLELSWTLGQLNLLTWLFCALTDLTTGFSILCKGWRSVYFNPSRKGFLGLAPTTLPQTFLQHQRWSQAVFHVFLSKYCPFIFGFGRMSLSFRISSCFLLFWPLNSLPSLCYATIPSFCLLRGIPLFPKLTSGWVLPYAYVAIAHYGYSIGEFVRCGGTFRRWWNEQRMWLNKGLTSHLAGLIEAILTVMGFAKLRFVITAKAFSDDDVSKRYEQEKMEFGSSSPILTVLATMAIFNFLSFGWKVTRMVLDSEIAVLNSLAFQILLTGMFVIINLPLYEGIFVRMDKGSVPFSVTFQALVFALFAHLLGLYL